MMSLVKAIVLAVFSTEVGLVKNSTGLMSLLPDSMALGGLLYNCCEKLVQHIMGRAESFRGTGFSPFRKEKLSKEVLVCLCWSVKCLWYKLIDIHLYTIAVFPRI